MNHNDTRDPDTIEADIRRTQEDMSRTVDRIGDQMSPRNLFNALLDKADENGIDARYILDGARRNPLALGLISAGGIWLISDYDAKPSAFTSDSGSNGVSANAHDYDPDHRAYIEHMSRIERRPDEEDQFYYRRRDEHRGTYLMIERGHDEDDKSYRQRLDDATGRMREKRDRFADSARQTRTDLARRGQRTAEKGRDAYYSNPLVGGLAAAIVGAIAGSVIPASQTEREKLGPQGARALDKAEETAKQAGEQARKKKDEVVERTNQKMEEKGPS
ncbi:DUF3618 domain-containing protein [Altererythrobacter aurantiacus]|uniref:DUF3618 domain-containing protein n=1 Tax=Parapontixanthobacter aurantiacus TaxID=1463599 RepID=A0A844ZI54_9SPHN|nr:DUF3618 domain-containing protein [Parapontixanthobacter aurantiacus]MXO86932.1 DUF3618 domain-containing protein [Parapontixanthobacter aurantiacus]